MGMCLIIWYMIVYIYSAFPCLLHPLLFLLCFCLSCHCHHCRAHCCSLFHLLFLCCYFIFFIARATVVKLVASSIIFVTLLLESPLLSSLLFIIFIDLLFAISKIMRTMNSDELNNSMILHRYFTFPTSFCWIVFSMCCTAFFGYSNFGCSCYWLFCL